MNSIKRLYEDNEKDDSEHEVNDDGKPQQHRRPQQRYRRDGRNSRDNDGRVANRNQHTQKKGKSLDNKGIRAEDIKYCDEETREMVRQIFNETIMRKEFTLGDWRKVTIKVIRKRGDE